jgi:hypothetical protein
VQVRAWSGSLWLDILIALVGLVAFGGFARAAGYRSAAEIRGSLRMSKDELVEALRAES